MLPLNYQIISTSAGRVSKHIRGPALLFNRQELNFKDHDFYFKTLPIQLTRGWEMRALGCCWWKENLTNSFLAYNVKKKTEQYIL